MPRSSLAQDLRRLEAFLTSPEVPPKSHARHRGSERSPEVSWDPAAFGGSQRLGFLFRALLGTLLRRGPGPGAEGLEPGRLLAAGAEAAGRGALSVRILAELRAELHRARELLIAKGAWRAEAEPWWHPLPAPSPLETLAAELAGDLRLPEAPDLLQAFGRSAGERRWWVQRPLLDPRWTRTVYRRLERAFEEGEILLKAGGVGADAKISARRSDLVGYFDGRESALLERAPEAALLIQSLLRQVPAALSAAFPKKSFYPPQRAMLARYPAPSVGYDAHLDNPGGADDNHRLLTLVLYLNPPEAPCAGGGLSLWGSASDVAGAPDETLPASSGTAALFDSRQIPHRVEPLGDGPTRWALTLWLSDLPQAPPPPEPPPAPSLTELLLPISRPPLPQGHVLFHRLDGAGQDPRGRILVQPSDDANPRAGIVCTTYRAGKALLDWCEHHLDLGFGHLFLVFDHLSEPEEEQLAAEIRSRHPLERVTIRDGEELLREGWRELGQGEETEDLRRWARGGDSSVAHAARQTLNASLALRAASAASLDWLFHLDDDERFYLEGAGRGGATLGRHLAAARRCGWKRITYANHELSLPWDEGTPPRFKINPRLAAARLGAAGWRQLVAHLRMGQRDPRPYFRAYHNGKSAVFVPVARHAAGVHGWALRQEAGSEDPSAFLAGPSILHFHLPTAESFLQTYRRKAQAPDPETRPFQPSPLEEAALAALRADPTAADATESLQEIYRQRTGFSKKELELLEDAGLLFEPAE